MSKITGLLLAAGAGRRFGQDKLTHALPNGELLAVRACRNLAAGVDEVLAVVRPGNGMLADSLAAQGAKVVVFADADLGMGSSLAFAVQACPDAGGWLVALADMPWIAPATISRLAESLHAGAAIVAPRYQGRRGHPVGFAGRFAGDLAGLSGDIGAKSVISAHLHHLLIIDCDDPGVLRDVDRPADLTHLIL
ncbi:nucleotidyltransferase family protein [Methylomonas rivi]|uniref:Nucleotidyltransferase family protein n=1 Tax=Methylomonas rivi TaxID=2952226 RepID=A0ABT1U8B0_9GAMM|nr:nucleotidyltransferase family protein [Methylomonas sp. WSC-6]MCQ8130080.1 nucleotidyltransferase family protein [Methylomonas sp. WSC-6]